MGEAVAVHPAVAEDAGVVCGAVALAAAQVAMHSSNQAELR